ncbi:hypothetical protein P9112_011087 [Eukaryota sp. TZLM1-RC]
MTVFYFSCLLIICMIILHVHPWNSIPEIGTPPPSRQYCHSLTIGESIFYFGGMDENDTILKDIWVFNGTDSSWMQLPSLGTAPLFLWGCLFHHQSSIFYFGADDTNVIFKYSLRDYTWTMLPYDINAPSPRQMMSCEQLTINGEQFGVIIGGSSSDVELLSEVCILNLSTLTWQVIDNCTFSGRQFPNTAVVDFLPSSILMFSGATSENSMYEDDNDTWLLQFSSIDGKVTVHSRNVTDLIGGEIPQSVILSTSTYHPGLSLFFVIGGWMNSRHASFSKLQVVFLNNSTNISSWEWKSYPLKLEGFNALNFSIFSLDSATSNVVCGQLLVFGGFFNEEVVSNMLLKVIPNSNFSFSLTSQHQIVTSSFSHHSLVTVGLSSYVIGGYMSGDSLLESVIWNLNLSDYSWSSIAIESSYIAERRVGACVVGFGTRIYYLFGTLVISNTMTSSVDVFNPITSSWSKFETYGEIPPVRSHSCCTRHHSYVFVYGGRTSSGISSGLFVLNLQSGEWISIEQPSPRPPSLERCGLSVVRSAYFPYLMLSFGRLGSWMPYQSHLWKVDLQEVIVNCSATWIDQPLILDGNMWDADSFQYLIFDNILLLLGGENWNHFVGYMSFFILPEFYDKSPVFLQLIGQLDSFVIPTLAFATAGHGNSVIMFGGTLTRKGMEIPNFGLSSLYVQQFDCDFLFNSSCNQPCFIGYVLEFDSLSNRSVCQPCLPGSVGTYFEGIVGCKPCPAGFYSTSAALVGEDSCIPCPFDTFQPVEGSTTCLPCPLGMVCPVGSINPIETDTFQTLSLTTLQPQLPESNSAAVSSISRRIFIIVFIFITVFLIWMVLLGRKSSLILKIDIFSRQHYTENDDYMVKRKTQMGSLFTYWFLFLSTAFVAVLFVEFSMDNISFLRLMEPAFLLSEEVLFSGNITLSVDSSFSNTLSKISPNIDGLECANIQFLEYPEYISLFLNHCLVTDNARVLFSTMSSDSFAPSLVLNISSVSSLPWGSSFFSRRLEAPIGKVFRGRNPSVFSVELTKSFYYDIPNNQSFYGYHIRSDGVTSGSSVYHYDFLFNTGIEVIVEFGKSQMGLIIERREKETFVTFISAILGAMAGLSGAVSFFLSLCEIIYHKNKKFFKKVFRDPIIERRLPENPLYSAAMELKTNVCPQ